MPTVTLTAKTLPTLKPGPTGRTDYFDAGAHIPGFGIRVSAAKRTWFLLYRKHGQLKRLTVGTFKPMGLAAARMAAGRALLTAQVSDVDPAAEKKARRAAQTFGELAAQYLELHAKAKKRTWREDARQLRSIVLPKWRNRRTVEIAKADVSALIDEAATKRGGYAANRLHALLSKVFRWAVSRSKLEANPMAGLQKPAAETSRDRELTPDELRALWARLAAAEADQTMPAGVALWIRLRALTAQRASSVAKMKWADVNLEDRVWDIPAADMKGKKPHVCPLSPAVCALLTAQRATLPRDAEYVLEGGRSRRKRLGVTETLGIPNFRPTDLRRTAATGMARAGIARFIVARVLGHADRTVTGIYDRYEYLNEKRIALDTWARRLDEILTESASGAIVPFVKA